MKSKYLKTSSMSGEIRSILENKRILILGFGMEGRSTYRLLRSWFPEMPLSIADRNANITRTGEVINSDPCVTFCTGEDYLGSCRDYDLIIKSPGVPYELIATHCKASCITSQTDLFMRAYASRVIGVTGTKGKSTTASLIHHILITAGRKALLAGNIGVPPLDLADKIEDDTDLVFEMSSHQLEHISIAPHIAVLLNVFPEHLDHYKDFTAYKMAKFNISNKQAAGGILVYNVDDPLIRELVEEQKGMKKLLSFSMERECANAFLGGNEMEFYQEQGIDFQIQASLAMDLPGRHNALNMMASVLVCIEKGIGTRDIELGLRTYRRLEHRLEFVGTFKGISFYDDSIATIPQACIEALKTLEKVDLLILGGHDRQLEYHTLYQWLKHNPVPNLVFMGNAGRRMYDEWIHFTGSDKGAFFVGNLEEAFDIIRRTLTEGDVCLLSPAAASYGMFRNFEERGTVFKKMAAAL